MSGWVKLHRQLLDHWCAEDPLFFSVWARLLLEANFEDKKRVINGCPVIVKRGSLVYGREAFSQRSGVSVSKLRRIISVLESESMISQQKTSKYSIISIVNYDDYQETDQQNASRRPAETDVSGRKHDQQNSRKSTNKTSVCGDIEKNLTNKTPADDQQTTTHKEVKEFKNINTPRKSAVPPVTVTTFLDNCKVNGEKPIPSDDPVFEYSHQVGIPDEFLRLAWREFVERNIESGKRYKNWRQAFRNCVRANWYKLWWLEGYTYTLTTMGKQAEIKHRGAA